MTPAFAVPTFAVIGAVNHGKSSVVSALAEDDSVRVSPMPGETVDNQRFALGDLLVFHDTPGFQNARKTLDEILRAPKATAPLDVFADFVRRHRHEPDFDAECRLFEPVIAGAGVIYVVDASRPVKDIHRCEMELLRLSGAPRLAIINRTGAETDAADHTGEWKPLLGQHFNAVREFNAQRASFTDRKDLLEALANIEREWKPALLAAVQALENAREERLDEAAALLTDLLVESLQHSESVSLDTADDALRAKASAELLQRFTQGLAAMEQRCHDRIIRVHAHSRIHAPADAAALFGNALFSEATWKLFGLNPKQLVSAGAMAGAAVGASLDVLTVGHTLLAGSALGAALGAGSAYWVGKRRPEISVNLPGSHLPRALQFILPNKLRLGGGELAVGPMQALNFPWILIDRAACTLAFVSSRSHARRDRVDLQVDSLLPQLAELGLTVVSWPSEHRKTCERAFATLRRGKPLNDNERAQLHSVIRQQFGRIAAAEPSINSSD